MDELGETLSWAKQHQVPVILFGPVPEYDSPLPRLLAYSIAWNRPELTSQHRVEGAEALDAEMQKMAANTWHVPYISLYQAICGVTRCIEYADAAHGIPLMYDEDHLDRFGSSLIMQNLVDQGILH
jgi:hypothetical protein